MSSNTKPVSLILQSEDTLQPRDVPQQPPLVSVGSPEEGEAPCPQEDPKTVLATLINTRIGNTEKLQKGMDKTGG